MNKVIELENALTGLFRKGTEVSYSETEIDEFLAKIDYDTLLQAVWNNAETVYAYRADGEHASLHHPTDKKAANVRYIIKIF